MIKCNSCHKYKPAVCLVCYNRAVNKPKKKHKHQWFPTETIIPLDKNGYLTRDLAKYIKDTRKWVCFCGKVRWVKEK